MRPSHYAFAILLTAASLCAPLRGQPPEIAKALTQFRDFYAGAAEGENVTLTGTQELVATPRDAMNFATSLGSDGKWPDIDYASRAASNWPPTTHCYRLLAMAGAAPTADDKAPLLNAIHSGLSLWATLDLQCPNWWYNKIGVPRTLGAVAILMGDQLTPQELDYISTKVLPRGEIAMTGQNRVWLAGNTMMRGLLTADRPTIDRAAAAIWDEVRITEQEGIQPDFSFHQHGAQQQFGNYGMAFAVEFCRWGAILRDTPWAMPDSRLAIARDYLLHGQAWVSYRGSMDISSCGRQLFPGSPRSKAETIGRVMQAMTSVDPSHKTDYLAYISRNAPEPPGDLPGDRFFWRSDYLIHRTPSFYASLKMHSKRVVGGESLNRENLSGYYLSDGALFLYARGDEYSDIFPAWDWCKIPGVTCPQNTNPPPFTAKSLQTDRTFIGGVSDGQFSCAAMDYARDGVAAHKAWFFAANAVVCLGSGIHSESADVIATTINQCLLRGDAKMRASGVESIMPPGATTIPNVEWIEHDNFRYIFAAPAAIHSDIGAKTGNWHRVFDNPATPKPDVTLNLFTLWLDHGTAPAAASYAYTVIPAGGAIVPTQLIENTDALQAVKLDDHRVAAIFWKPGKLDLKSGSIEVNQPCLVLVNQSDHSATVADPTQSLESLTLSIPGRHIDVQLPRGPDRGRSIRVELRS